jgi:hypothetical protein
MQTLRGADFGIILDDNLDVRSLADENETC